MAIEDYYSELVRYRPTSALGSYGERVESLGDAATLQGYIGEPSSTRTARASQLDVDIVGRLYAEPTADLQPYDYVVDTDGECYQVASRVRDVAHRGHHVEADLTHIRGGVPGAD